MDGEVRGGVLTEISELLLAFPFFDDFLVLSNLKILSRVLEHGVLLCSTVPGSVVCVVINS